MSTGEAMTCGATRTFTAVVAGVLLSAGCGASSVPAPATVTVRVPAPAAPDAAAPDAPAAAKNVTLPDVVGRNGAIAQDTLKALGLTKIDLAADPTSGRQVVLSPANWTVTKMEPKAGTQVRTDQTVVVTMTK